MLYRWSAKENITEKVFDVHKFSAYRFLLRNGKISFPSRDGFERLVISLEGDLEVYLPDNELEIVLNSKDLCYMPPHENRFEARGQNCFAVMFQGMSRSNAGALIKRFNEVEVELRGTAGCRRRVYTCIGEKDLCWMLAGFTEGFKGEWTSYPSHKHDDKLEAYVYYGPMGSVGLQLIEDKERIEAYVVRPRDIVFIGSGYHPNVPAPDCEMRYLWVLYPLNERNMLVDLKPENSAFL
jgi:5-deoxy-glucuronate isomerase